MYHDRRDRCTPHTLGGRRQHEPHLGAAVFWPTDGGNLIRLCVDDNVIFMTMYMCFAAHARVQIVVHVAASYIFGSALHSSYTIVSHHVNTSQCDNSSTSRATAAYCAGNHRRAQVRGQMQHPAYDHLQDSQTPQPTDTTKRRPRKSSTFITTPL